MTDPHPTQEPLSTEDLLRMIGRELQAIRRATAKTATWVQFMGVVTLVGLIIGFVALGSADTSN